MRAPLSVEELARQICSDDRDAIDPAILVAAREYPRWTMNPASYAELQRALYAANRWGRPSTAERPAPVLYRISVTIDPYVAPRALWCSNPKGNGKLISLQGYEALGSPVVTAQEPDSESSSESAPRT